MSNKLILRLAVVVLTMVTVACDRNDGPGPEIHDIKYAALGASGEQLQGDSPARCVLDQYIGLTWEVKTDTPGLHDWRNTYSWYKPDESNDPEGLDYRGASDGGQCDGSACDTFEYVRAVNEAGFCGYNDWRMPSRDELGSISDPRLVESRPTINMKYFPYTQPEEYWSANDYHFQWDTAWVWSFQHGHDRVEWKKSPRRVRLVRGEATLLERVKD
jgi:hypothetical protein